MADLDAICWVQNKAGKQTKKRKLINDNQRKHPKNEIVVEERRFENGTTNKLPLSNSALKRIHLEGTMEKTQIKEMIIDNMEAKQAKTTSQSKAQQQHMGSGFQFAELNIHHRGNTERTLAMVRRAIRMGYDTVVVNIDIGSLLSPEQTKQEGGPSPSKRAKKKKYGGISQPTIAQDQEAEENVVPDPFLVDPARLDLSALRVAGKRFRQYSRLTVSVDALTIHRLHHHRKLRLYDLVAVRVPDEQMLITLARKGEFVDLVTLDERGERIPWLWKQKIVQSCVAAGLHFELCYATALASSEYRRQFLTNARQLMEITRGGRGVVLSSGAEDMLGIRGPFDAANMATLFGRHAKEGRKLVAANARCVLLRAEARRLTIRGAIHITDDSEQIPAPSASRTSFHQLCDIPIFATELASMQTNNQEVTENKIQSEEKVIEISVNGGLDLD